MNGTRPPARSVFHAIAWSASTHRWARIVGGVVVGVGAMLALDEALGRPAWMNSGLVVLAAIVVPPALALCLPLPRPWLKLEVGAGGLVLTRRDGEVRLACEDARLFSGEGGVDLPGSGLFWKTMYIATRTEGFRLALPPVRCRRCYEALAAACPFAVGVSFEGEVHLPDFTGVAEAPQMTGHALAVAAREVRRQALAALLSGVGLVVMATMGLWLASRNPIEGFRMRAALAAAILGGGLLLAHGLRRLRRNRQLLRIAEEKGRDTFRPGAQ